MTASFHNKILYVNLSDGTTAVREPGEVYFRRYMGGWNIVAEILLNEMAAGIDPLGPDNLLAFASGILTGLPVGGTARNAIGAKSPLTGGFGASEVGGFWGSELKQAGFDALVVKGKAKEPVYLHIHNGEVELRPASHLWGKDVKATQAGICQELDDQKVQCAMIGPGGENLVLYANIMNGLYDAAGRTGLGAVMGSKNLKAVAVRGTQRLATAKPDKMSEIARAKAEELRNTEWLKTGTGQYLEGMVLTGNLPIRNFRDGVFEGAEKISANVFLPEIGVGREGCFACAGRCKKVVETETPYPVDPAYGGPEYETIGALGSNCGVDDIVAISKANELCNAYSLDTIGVGVNIALAMEAFEAGLLTLEDTGGIDLHFGNAEALVQLTEQIAFRKGFGDFLAEGPAQVAAKIGGGAEKYAMHVKNQAYPMHEPRFKRGLSIGYAVSPTGADHIHSLMDDSLVNNGEDGLLANMTMRGLGILERLPIEDLGPEKVRAAVYYTNSMGLINCLPICLFTNWSLDALVDVVNAATGWNTNVFELMKVGERSLTLARVFNLREGLTAEDDHLPQRSHEPTTDGALADGGIDPEQLAEAIKMYYGMMGWDRDSGVPRVDKLHELGVSWAADHLPRA